MKQVLFIIVSAVSALGAIYANSERGVHLPIQRGRRLHRKRDGDIADTGLGDVLDVTYTVLVEVGETLTPLVIDTGSADLWLISDRCGQPCARTGVPLYREASFIPARQDVQLLYGDSRTGTHAFGHIGTDAVGVAGISVPKQYFASIVDTDTTVLETGCAGILGLGFPPISAIWRQLLATEYYGPVPPIHKRAAGSTGELDFPDLGFLNGTLTDGSRKREQAHDPYASATDTFPTIGPLFTRLVTWKLLSRPMVVTALQRDTVSLSDNAGTFSLGALPSGLVDDQLTWVPVRGYTAQEGGLAPPPDAPDEVYPLVWEIPLDDVYFDGVKLPRSTLSPSSISLSALVDTGNSLIRGPLDVVTHILSMVGENFDCSIPHNLSFEIGGVQFPVDPRDFAHPASVIPGTLYPNQLARCTTVLAATDPPGNGGFLYSWSLGDPFLKSVLVAFYYGNLTRPSHDPPRVGLLSTVPSDADSELQEAVASAVYNGGIFPSTSEPAPYATPIRMHTMTMANMPPGVTQGWQWQRAYNGARRARVSKETCWLTTAVVVGVFGYHLYG